MPRIIDEKVFTTQLKLKVSLPSDELKKIDECPAALRSLMLRSQMLRVLEELKCTCHVSKNFKASLVFEVS